MTEQTMEAPDMGTVEKVFRYASDTIVEASRLRGEFQQLSNEVAGLREDLNRLRRQNEFLDEQLTQVREQRDSANRKVHELETTLHERNQHVAELNRRLETSEREREQLAGQLSSVGRERDDAQLRVMELEEANAKLTTELASIEAKVAELGKLFGLAASTSEPNAANLVITDPALRQPGETEEQHRERTQPRDPVTQQWRSPYDPPKAEDPAQGNEWDPYTQR